MFANVVRARVLTGDIGEAGREVAIKIIRNNDSMYAGVIQVETCSDLFLGIGRGSKKFKSSISSIKQTQKIRST